LDEHEVDDLIFEEEAGVPKEGVKWMDLAHVDMMNPFNVQTFEQYMINIQSPAKEIKLEALEGNLFTIKYILGDSLKVLTEGPMVV
jgi:hypothetical protein